MKKIINKLMIGAVVLFVLACADDSLDPFRFNELQKGNMLALRGDGDANANFFFKNQIFGDEVFSIEAEFLSDNQDLLSEVQVFARNLITDTRSPLLNTIPGSAFTIPSGGKYRYGTITVTLDAVLNGLNITNPTTLGENDIQVETDIILSDGTTVRSEAMINAGLFASVVFYPAHKIPYRATDVNDFKPAATTKMAGEVVKDANGKVTGRPVFPLKSGAKDTLVIEFDQVIDNTPTVTYSPVGAVTVDPLVKVSDKKFYQIVTAGATYTGAVTATVSGAMSDDFGVMLTQNNKNQTLNVDNTEPRVVSTVTGDRIGRGQFVTITVTFNEKMSAKSANALKATITGQNLEAVTNATMTLNTAGTSASLIYIFKEADITVPATHGALTLTFTGGADDAGNALPGGSIMGSLICDVGTPPAPTFDLLPPDYDLGTQIYWSAEQTTGTNTDGAIQGTIYFVAIDADEPAPTAFAVDADGNATWTMADKDPDEDVEDLVVNRQTGTVTTKADGTTGLVYTTFNANGTFDVYAVFVGSTGNISAITATPQIADLVMN